MATHSTTGLYPFDPYGNNPECLVLNELQALQTPGRDDFYFLIPKAAPFFVKSMVVRNDTTGEVYVEGRDYVVGHWFVEAMTQTGRSIAGSIRFLNRDIGGVVSLTYQTVGGQWGFDDQAILEELSNKVVNPLTRGWAQIDTIPEMFPPIPHEQRVDDLIGFQDIVDSIGNVVDAISESESGRFSQHMDDRLNPHNVTKAQVGLDNVNNYIFADEAEARAGLRSDRYMSPSNVRATVDEHAVQPLNTHLADTSNPHAVTKFQVGLGNIENYLFADDVEAREASLTTRYMSPRGVGQALDQFYIDRLAPVLSGDPTNPTGVTKEVIGLGEVENYPIAVQSEAFAGDRNDRYMTPLRTAEAIDVLALIPLGQHAADINNPHDVDKFQIGLGNVQNFSIATNSEAIAGERDDLYMTPMTTKEAIAAVTGTVLESHVNDFENPHQVSAEQVGAYTIAEIDSITTGLLPTDGVAYDASRVFGLLKPDLAADILTGTAFDSDRVGGLTVPDLIVGPLTDNFVRFLSFDVNNATGTQYIRLLTRPQQLADDNSVIESGNASFLLTGRHVNGRDAILQIHMGEPGTPASATILNGGEFDLNIATTMNVENGQELWIQPAGVIENINLIPIAELYNTELEDPTAIVSADTLDSPTMVTVTGLYDAEFSDIDQQMTDVVSELDTVFGDATTALLA